MSEHIQAVDDQRWDFKTVNVIDPKRLDAITKPFGVFVVSCPTDPRYIRIPGRFNASHSEATAAIFAEDDRMGPPVSDNGWVRLMSA